MAIMKEANVIYDKHTLMLAYVYSLQLGRG